MVCRQWTKIGIRLDASFVRATRELLNLGVAYGLRPKLSFPTCRMEF